MRKPYGRQVAPPVLDVSPEVREHILKPMLRYKKLDLRPLTPYRRYPRFRRQLSPLPRFSIKGSLLQAYPGDPTQFSPDSPIMHPILNSARRAESS